MTAYQRQFSLADVATTPTPVTVPIRMPSAASIPGGLGGAENRAIGRLASLVYNVVANLEAPSFQEPLNKVVAECNAALEACLEAQRDFCDHDGSVMTAADELERLARLLLVVDHTDQVIIMRQIRRILGRFDVADA